MPLSQLPAFLSACFDDLAAALDRRSAPRLLLLLTGVLFARGRRTVTSWFRAAGITTASPTLITPPCLQRSLGRRPARRGVGPPLAVHRPQAADASPPWRLLAVRHRRYTDRPLAPRCRGLASTTTPRRDRLARSSSTATSGSRSLGWPTTPPGTRWPCRCVLCSTSAPSTSPNWPSVIRGTFAPSWSWLSNWPIGCASGWAAWARSCDGSRSTWCCTAWSRRGGGRVVRRRWWTAAVRRGTRSRVGRRTRTNERRCKARSCGEKSRRLWGSGLLLLHFAIFFSVSALLAVCTRSTIVCAIGSLLFWFLCWGMNYGRHVAVLLPESGGGTSAFVTLVDAGYWVLPKPADHNWLLFDLLRADHYFGRPLDYDVLHEQGSVSLPASILTSLVFAAVVLVLSARWFARTDY